MSEEYLVEMRNIQKSFPGVRALKNGCIKIKKGEIHALIGENGAGKSTLMKVLMGDYSADEGEIIFNGKPYARGLPEKIRKASFCIVPQEISLVDTVDIAENVWLGREKQFVRCGLISNKARYKATQKLFERIGIDLDPKDLTQELSLAQKQLVTVAKSVSYNTDVIVMDEPTSALSELEVEKLFIIMNDLKDDGKSIIFISHKLNEIFTIAQRITVMRDGDFIDEHHTSEISHNELVTQIAGREISDLYPTKSNELGEKVFEIKNFTTKGAFNNVDLFVRAGEIVSLYGLVGAGRSEVMRSVFGIDNCDSGKVYISGSEVEIKHPKAAIKNGIAFVTEDRLTTGIIGMQSVSENVSLANLLRFSTKLRFLRPKYETAKVSEMLKRLNVKFASLQQTMSSLSGGNQQKAILAKWMLTDPKIFILDEPTRGIDVGSKSDIHKLIAKLAESGMAILIISSELEEAMGVADRIITMHEGSVMAEFQRKDFSQDAMIKAAFGLAN